MSWEEKTKQAWNELHFWVSREMSLTLVFWLAAFLAASIRWVYLR